MKTKDYPGADLSKKKLLKRLTHAYQLGGALLLGSDAPPEARLEMEIVLLDFLSDPGTASSRRLAYAARQFRGRP